MSPAEDAPGDSPSPLAGFDPAAARAAHQRLRAELGKVIVGLDAAIDELLVSIFSRGHCLLVGVPGLAKTLLVNTLARTLGLTFSRIQFTPDLMPADITGTEVIQEDRSTGQRAFKFIRGPIFANVILADEINRTPPKTQAALLEAMQERQVTVGGVKHALTPPFFVLATQNPIEQEGTYPLPEAQLDRFMFLVRVDYPSAEEELKIVEMTTRTMDVEVEPVMSAAEMLAIQHAVREMPIAEHLVRWVLQVVRRTRSSDLETPEWVRKRVAWGAGPRASQFMILGAKARALLHGRSCVALDDVRAVALPVLRHRVLLNYGAQAEGWTSDRLITELMAALPAAGSGALRDERLSNIIST